MGSRLYFSLNQLKPQKNYAAGSITDVTSSEMPGLVNISFSQLKLKKGGSQEPIWHPNAQKIGYCLQGAALISIRSPSANDLFTVKEGDVFFVPEGHIHHIVNIGEGDATIGFALNHVKPETMFLSKAVHSLTPAVFNATFKMGSDFFAGLIKAKEQDQIKTLPGLKKPAQEIPSRFKFNVAMSSKPVLTAGGYLQLATKTNLPVLNGLGILRFGLNPKGIVEPHWHTNAGELVYIVKGRTRITVLSPDGKVEALEVSGGEGAFAPASHFHNIENIGSDEVEVVAYFSHADPNYIGIGEVVGAYTNEVLASVFNVSPSYFDTFKKPEQPLVIVPV